MQDREAVKSSRQMGDAYIVAPQLHLACVCSPTPINPCRAQHRFNHRLHQGHVFDMQEGQPLTKRLLLMLALDSETDFSRAIGQADFRAVSWLRQDRGCVTSRSGLVSALGQQL